MAGQTPMMFACTHTPNSWRWLWKGTFVCHSEGQGHSLGTKMMAMEMEMGAKGGPTRPTATERTTTSKWDCVFKWGASEMPCQTRAFFTNTKKLSFLSRCLGIRISPKSNISSFWQIKYLQFLPKTAIIKGGISVHFPSSHKIILFCHCLDTSSIVSGVLSPKI